MNAEKLKEKMSENGISNEKMAYNIGITRNTFENKLKGKTGFTLSEAIKIKKILNLSKKEFDNFFGI